MDRRQFMQSVIGGAVGVMAGEVLAGNPPGQILSTTAGPVRSRIALVKTAKRTDGITRAIRLLGVNPVAGKKVLLKPNFNTADPFPASTHNDTLVQLVTELRQMGATTITVGERSGPPDTRDVLKEKGIFDLCKRLDLGLINFEELPPDRWQKAGSLPCP